MDASKLEKLNHLLASIKRNSVSPKEIEDFLKMVLETVKSSKDELRDISDENVEKIRDYVARLEENSQKALNAVDAKSNALAGQLEAKIALLKGLIAKVKTLKPKNGVDGISPDPSDVVPLVLAKLPKAEPFTVKREGVVREINTGKKDDIKIELKQIEGTDKLEKGILDRAVSILDQRTKFLINKNVKHDGTLSGSGTDADPLTVVGGGSVDSVNGQTGVVVLDTGDIAESGNLYYTEARVSANTDVSANTSARHDALTVTDSSEIDFTLTGQDLTAVLKASSIDETKLDASVNASLDLADSSLQSISGLDHGLLGDLLADDHTQYALLAGRLGGQSLEGGYVFNEAGGDFDFRIEGDTDVNVFFVDASTDRIGIGTNAPAVGLDIVNTSGSKLVRTKSTGAAASFVFERTDGAWGRLQAGSAANMYFQNGKTFRIVEAASDDTSIDGTFGTDVASHLEIQPGGNVIIGANTGSLTGTSSARLGIGRTSPNFPLDVSGQANFDGNVNLLRNMIRVPEVAGNIATFAFGVSNTAGTTSQELYADILAVITQATPSALKGELAFRTNRGDAVVEAMRLDDEGNVGVGTTTFGTSAAKVLAIANGTEPSTSPADMVQLYSVDLSAGNATLGLRTETAVVSEAVTSDRTLSVKINGTTYKILLKA